MSETNSIHETSILTNCTLGKGVSIGPFCFLTDTDLGDDVMIEGNARIEKSTLEKGATILWGGIIRESHIGSWCVIGCEVKQSRLGAHNKAKHPGTSITSATTGEHVNFGWGCRCANYDGKGKGTFVIGDDVFLGCNSVISVRANETTTIHTGTKIGANVHIHTPIPPHSLAYLDSETGKTTIREGYYNQK